MHVQYGQLDVGDQETLLHDLLLDVVEKCVPLQSLGCQPSMGQFSLCSHWSIFHV